MAASLRLLRIFPWACIFLLALFIGDGAFAAENFQVPVSNLRVYSGPSRSTPIIATLQKGQTVLAGANPAGGLKKVLVNDPSGHKKIGYVFLADLRSRGPKIHAQSDNDEEDNSFSTSRSKRKRFGFGIMPGLNYMSESSRNITDASGNTYVGSSLSGTNFEFGLSGYMDVSPTFALGAFLEYKPTTLSGNLSYQGSSTTTPVTFGQTFYALGATGQFYRRPGGSFWYGPGCEVDIGSGSNMQGTSYLGAPFNLTVSTNIFVFLFGTIGYDIPLSQSFYATPSMKIGAIVNTSAMIIEGDATVTLGYKF